MTPSICLDVDRRPWDHYVDTHPDTTPFHRWSWSQSLENSFGHEAVRLTAVRDGIIVGVLPVVIVRSRLTGTRVISTPFAGHGGPLPRRPAQGVPGDACWRQLARPCDGCCPRLQTVVRPS